MTSPTHDKEWKLMLFGALCVTTGWYITHSILLSFIGTCFIILLYGVTK